MKLSTLNWNVVGLLFVLMSIGVTSAGESATNSGYVCVHARIPPCLDGKLNDTCWTNAHWKPLSHRAGAEQGALEDTRVAFLWDDVFLYFAADVDESYIVSNFKNRDENIFEEDCVEFFIDPQGEGRFYYELEISPSGVIWDSITLNEGARRVVADKHWNAPSLEVKTRMRPGDWTMEGRIRFDELLSAYHVPPQPDDQWRLNAYRCNTLEGNKAVYSALFSTDDFHKPSAFGSFRFENEERKRELAAAKEAARRFLSVCDLTGWRSLAKDMPHLKVDSTRGTPFVFVEANGSWQTKKGFGRFGMRKDTGKALDLMVAHPVKGFDATRVTWRVDHSCRLMVFAALNKGGAQAVQNGGADGTYIRLRHEKTGELGCLHVIDEDMQMMLIEVPCPGDIILTVEGGPAESTRCDGCTLAVYQSENGIQK